MSRFLILFLLAFGLASTAAAASPEESRRAGQIQVQAKEALDGGDANEALKLANRAIALDDGPGTWLAQQLRVEILERRGDYEAAMTHLRDYLRLDGLFPEHRSWGEEAKSRLGRKLANRDAVSAARKTRRGVGIGLLAGGAVPLGIGLGFVGNFAAQGGDPAQSGGWLDSGLALVGVGAGLEIAGAVLVATSAEPKRRAALGIDFGPRLASAGGGWRVGLHGRW
jgi:tetratricopeptide (TPR) repeat protein